MNGSGSGMRPSAGPAPAVRPRPRFRGALAPPPLHPIPPAVGSRGEGHGDPGGVGPRASGRPYPNVGVPPYVACEPSYPAPWQGPPPDDPPLHRDPWSPCHRHLPGVALPLIHATVTTSRFPANTDTPSDQMVSLLPSQCLAGGPFPPSAPGSLSYGSVDDPLTHTHAHLARVTPEVI